MTTNLYSPARPERPAPLPVPGRALTIGAHPDDAEFGAGGLLARWASEGCHVTMLVVTDGSKGTWDASISTEELVTRRRQEQRNAADTLGAIDVVMLDHVDGELENTMELRRELCFWIRTTRPDVVLSHDPWKRYMLHPDHRATGIGAIDGVVAARDHLFFVDQLSDEVTKHRPSALLLWSADEPNHWEDIGTTFGTKIEALLCHSTQAETTMSDAHTGEDARFEFEARIKDWSQQQGEPVGLALAESFRRLTP